MPATTHPAQAPDPAVGIEATPAQTLGELQKLSGSGYPKVRHILRQQPGDVADRVSVLGPMVSDRKKRSLIAYLLLLTVWPWLSKQDRPLPAPVWARALSTQKGRKWTPTNVSAAWTDLEARGLIHRKRLARGVVIEPRREDGLADYTTPGLVPNDHRESYFILPPQFWSEEWFERLTLPGLAMLLIIAGETSDKAETWLTNDHAAGWYGFSARSIEAGIEDLRRNGLLTQRTEWITAPLSAIGKTQRHWYGLTGPFSYAARQALQQQTRSELEARTASAPTKDATQAPPKKKITKKLAKNASNTSTSNKKTLKNTTSSRKPQ